MPDVGVLDIVVAELEILELAQLSLQGRHLLG